MTRVIVLCERPRHLSAEDAVAWLRRATAALVQDGAANVYLTELASASMRWARAWDWLIEVEVSDASAGQRLVADPPWGQLLADLRLLGMRPCVAVADSARTTQLGAAST